MFLNRLTLCSLIALCLAGATARGDTLSFSIDMRDGVRTASVDTVSRNGVDYVPLGPIMRQIGGGYQLTPERAQVDLAERSAWLRANNPQVSASLGIFLLGAPVLRDDEDVLIAASDVDVFFEKAFRLTASVRASPSPARPAVERDSPVVYLPPESEPEALEPLPVVQLVEESGLQESALDESALETLDSFERPSGRVSDAPSAPQEPEPAPLEPLAVARVAATPGPGDRPAARKIEVVVIDPGHGGSDAGSQGATGVTEAEIVFGVAEYLKTALEAHNLKAVLTREKDRSPSRSERVFVANSRKGDLLISLHAGTAFSAEQRGVRIFVSGGRGESTASRYFEYSRRVADAVSAAVEEATGARSGGVYLLDCQVVGDVGMPGLMIEVGMLTNPDDESLLASAEHQANVAEGIAEGVMKYIESGGTES